MIGSGNKDEVQKSSAGSPARDVNPKIASVTLDNGVCALCDKKIGSKKDLLRHLLTTHRSVIEASKQLRCKSCNNDIDNVQKHLETVHKLKGSVCPICAKGFSKSNEVVDHYKTSHLQVMAKLSCAICKLVCANIKDLLLHYQDKHEVKQEHVNGRGDIQIEILKKNDKADVQGNSRARTENEKSSSEACTLCENKFDSKESLRQHYVTLHRSYITETKTWRCHECSTIFNTEEDMQKHLESEHKVEGSFCPICYKGFMTKLAASNHLKSLHVEVITKMSCSVCRLDFSNQDHLILHCQDKHGNGSKKEVYSSIDENKKEPKMWRCKNCVTTFTDTEEDMEQHLKMNHKIEGSFCPICGKDFTIALKAAEHLQKFHVEVITNPVCAICKLECTNRDDLMSHYRDKHADMGKKNKTGHVQCILCENRFQSNIAMARHCRSEHPEIFSESKVWVCKTCESGCISTETSIHKHIQNKHKVKDALCPICRTKFSTNFQAVKHIKSSHVEFATKPSCSVCKAPMNSDVRLVLHYNVKHKLQEEVNTKKVIKKQGEKPVEAAITKQEQPKVPNADANKKKGETDRERFECHVCSQRFIRDLDLAFHLADAHNLTILDLDVEKQKVFACPACEAKFKTLELAVEHVSRKHSDMKKKEMIFEQYICSYCKSALKTSTFKQHLVRCAISFGQLRCRYCLVDVADIKLLQEHVTTKHPTEELDIIRCPVCRKEYVSKEALLRHSQVRHPLRIRKNAPPVSLKRTLTISQRDGKNYYKCPFCNFACPVLPVTVKHILAKHENRKDEISDKVSMGMFGGTIRGSNSMSSNYSNLGKRTMRSNEPLTHNLPGPSSTNTDMSEKRRRSDIAAPYQTFGTAKSVNKYEVTKPYDSRSLVLGSSERRQFYAGGAESRISPWLCDASHGYGSRPFKTDVQSGAIGFECIICGHSYMSRAALDMHMKVNHADM